MLKGIRPRDLGFIALAIALDATLDCGVKSIALNPAPRSYLNQGGDIRNAAENLDSKDKDKESLIDRGIYEEVSFSLAGCSLLGTHRTLSRFSYEPEWGTKRIPKYYRVLEFTTSDYRRPVEHSENTEKGFISKMPDWMPGKSETAYLNRHSYSSGTFSRTTVKGDIRKKLRKVARELGLDPRLAVALGEVESGLNPEAVSPEGAIGVLQLMPRFFCKEPEIDVCMLYDPDENIRMGLEHLKSLLQRFRNDIELSLAAYNSGSRRVVEAGYAIPPIEQTHSYVKRVREAMEKVPLDSPDGFYALSWESSRPQKRKLEGNACYLD